MSRNWLNRTKWWIGGAVLVPTAIALLVYRPGWTGFGPDTTKSTERNAAGQVTKTVEVEQSGKTLWDWLSLLGVPLSLAVLGLWFQQLQQKRADDEVKEEVLQAYFDRLSALLIDQNLNALAVKVREDNSSTDEQRELVNSAVDVIRARTLSILRRFKKDAERKASVVLFLIDVEAISKLRLSLSGADLSDADLFRINLSGANLSGANLPFARFYNATLFRTNLSSANLVAAGFYKADLSQADLSQANLGFAFLNRANLSGANLSQADLSDADLSGTNLYKADLFGANLSDVRGWNENQIAAAKLCKTRLPEGCKLDPDRDCTELGIPTNEPD